MTLLFQPFQGFCLLLPWNKPLIPGFCTTMLQPLAGTSEYRRAWCQQEGTEVPAWTTAMPYPWKHFPWAIPNLLLPQQTAISFLAQLIFHSTTYQSACHFSYWDTSSRPQHKALSCSGQSRHQPPPVSHPRLPDSLCYVQHPAYLCCSGARRLSFCFSKSHKSQVAHTANIVKGQSHNPFLAWATLHKF